MCSSRAHELPIAQRYTWDWCVQFVYSLCSSYPVMSYHTTFVGSYALLFLPLIASQPSHPLSNSYIEARAASTFQLVFGPNRTEFGRIRRLRRRERVPCRQFRLAELRNAAWAVEIIVVVL